MVPPHPFDRGDVGDLAGDPAAVAGILQRVHEHGLVGDGEQDDVRHEPSPMLSASSHSATSSWSRNLAQLASGPGVAGLGEPPRLSGASFGGSADDPELGELHALNLDPDRWGRGLGRALLHAATEQLAAVGFDEAVLWVVPENGRAINLYESAGWAADEEARDQDVLGVTVQEVRYRRRLRVVPRGEPPNVRS